ncbi:glycoside hydrolase family 3 N-terminal domain-containing protein [Maritalea sp.]|uniref:glycoside hydrolase family 3 N-terminal domain-containing protein n=1 Tax=Maritalea sp. TaxID=2003361 RepID=UPI003EF997BE
MRVALIASLLVCMFLNASSAMAQTIREMAGQMIMIGFPHDKAGSDSHKRLAALVKAGQIGGVMYLKFNVKSLAEVTKMNRALNSAGAKFSPLIAIDQEGGVVERLTSSVGFTEIPKAREVALGMNKDGATELYSDLAKRMAKLGFNVNFGPVVDVIVNKNNPIIAKYGRSYSSRTDIVTKFAEAFIDGHHKAGLLTSLKHFPGHGSSAGDSHLGFVDITKSWTKAEYEPFEALIANNKADMIMAGHLYHKGFVQDGEGQVPASLSSVALTTVLRQGMGFDGVVISDDMEMGAITKHYGFEDAIIRAVRAGNDILLFSNTIKPSLGLPERILSVLEKEAARDPIFAQRISQSYQRVVAMKSKLN